MIQVQHIQQDLTTIMSRSLNTWFSSLCGDIIFNVSAYNNEPKQGGTEV
jgi:hypothetical protein